MVRGIQLVAVLALGGCGGPDKGTDSGAPPTTSTGSTTTSAPPNAEDDTATVDEGGSVTVDVAANDLLTSNPIDRSSVAVAGAPTHGTAVVQANGDVLYEHDGSETSTDSFTYTIADTTGAASAPATVRVTVTGINDLPVAVDDADVVDQGATVQIDLLANDSDVDDGLNPGGIAIVDQPLYAAIVLNGDGTVDYVHDGSGVDADSFTYTVTDFSGGVSNVATVELVVNTTNTPPVAVDDALFVPEGGQVNIDLALNDIDIDDGLDVGSIQIASNPAHGSLVLQLDGTVDYLHDGSETAADGFTYRISDNSGAPSNEASVQVVITPVNDPPVAVDDLADVYEGSLGNIAVLANDTDVDNLLAPSTVIVVTSPTHGTAVPLADGTVDYQHDGSPGASDSFAYTVQDASGAVSNPATVDLNVIAVNDPPTAVDDAGVVDEGGSAVIDLAANDTDPDDPLDPTSIVIGTYPAYGVVIVNGDGTVDYDHDGSETLSDGFSYTISDMGGNPSNSASVSVAITPVNDPPVAVADAYTVDEGSTVNVFAVLANDFDVDDGIDTGSAVIVTPPSHGAAIAGPGGNIGYGHDGSETLSDSFTYRVSDLAGAPSNTVTVSITVTPVNDPPVANNDAAVVPEGGLVNVAVLSNDTDPDNGFDLGSQTVTSGPAHGTVNERADGTIDYQHDGSETLTDSFTYFVEDLAGTASNAATVQITVTPVNDPPIAFDDYAGGVDQGQVINLDLWGNTSDPENSMDLGSVVIVTPPLHGSLHVVGDGTVDYLHDGTGVGTDGFTWTMADTSGAVTNVANIDFDIDPRPDLGTLYMIRESDDNLIAFSPSTGVSTTIGPLNTTFAFGDLAWDARTQQLFMVDGRGSRGLWTVNRTTGAATLVGLHNVVDMFGLTSDGRNLYGEAQGTLYQLNKTTGAATVVAPTQPDVSLTWDTRRDEMVGIVYTGSAYVIDRLTGAAVDLNVPAPIFLDNNGSAYSSASDSFWSVGWGGIVTQHFPIADYAQVTYATGLTSRDGVAYVPVAGAHRSEAFTATGNQGWFCGGTEQAHYVNYGNLTFDQCQARANGTAMQWYTGVSAPASGGWIGGHDATQATVAGSSWPTEELRPKTSTAPCVLAALDDRVPVVADPRPQTYFDAATGRTWHYWDLGNVLAEEAMAFASRHGARIINPNDVGMVGAVRGTAPTHWCFASALYNDTGNCNTGVSCDYTVGYFD